MASWQSDESDFIDHVASNNAIEQLFTPLSPTSSEDDKSLAATPSSSDAAELVGPQYAYQSYEMFYRSSEDCGMISSIDIFAIALETRHHNFASCGHDAGAQHSDERTEDMDDSASLRSSSLSSTESDMSQADPADNDACADTSTELYGLRRRSERHNKRKRTNYADLDTLSEDSETRKQNKKRKQNQSASRVHTPSSSPALAQSVPNGPLFVWESQCHQDMLGMMHQQQQQVTYHTFVLESGAQKLRNSGL